jgi:hypothetical protein
MTMIRSRTSRAAVGVVALMALTALGAGAKMRSATAAGPYGPDTCLWGFVWRDGRPGDHVCVTPATRSQTAADNAAGPSRVQPGGGPWGPDSCQGGFVWRSAWSGDHVCVVPATRTQAANDNAAGPSRRAIDLFSVTRPSTDTDIDMASGDVGGGQPTLEMNPNGAYTFRGHLHNYSVIAGYNLSVTCAVKLRDGNALTFSATGHVGSDSFLIAGSPDFNWNISGTSAQVANRWAAIPRDTFGATTCRSHADFDLAGLISQIRNVAGIVGAIIAIV